MEKEVKVTSVSVQVPYKSAGNVIIQKEVGFDIYKDESAYKAIPQLTENELKIANLPQQLVFYRADGKVVSSRGVKDGNMHVITDIVAMLKNMDIVI